MKNIETALRTNKQVSNYKLNIHEKTSFELFFVKGKLETVRCTDTCDREVTVYAEHDGFIGSAQFFVYPSTTPEQLETLVSEAAAKALLVSNKLYTLPEGETGSYSVESNFAQFEPAVLAQKIAETVFAANTVDGGSLNSVEVFVNQHRDTVISSRGMNKTQMRWDAMVEAIPTYNGERESVELYDQYNFNTLDVDTLYAQIAGMMQAVKARYEAVHPQAPLDCKVILGKVELSMLLGELARNLNYAAVYSHSAMFQKGDAVQKAPDGDLLTITMMGGTEGNTRSAKFDSDGLSLGEQIIVKDGVAVNYFGANRFGQYLGEVPTGELRCLCAAPGTAAEEEFAQGPYLEIISMSGLQVDCFGDYIGGEVRLAYYHDGEKLIPVTGISVSGSLTEVLNHIRLSSRISCWDEYKGPEKAILTGMKIF